jgi:hypothetical protein
MAVDDQFFIGVNSGPMSLLPRIVRKLAPMDTNEVKVVADRAGLAWQTVYKIQKGLIKNPTITTVESLDGVLFPRVKKKRKP